MSKLRLLIFDLDGTLVDSVEDYQISVNRLMREENLPKLTRDQVAQGLGHGLRSMVKGLFPHFKEHPQKLHDIEERFLRYYLEEDCTKKTKLYPGVIEFLKNWTGHLALVTNKSVEPTRKIMSHLKLDQFYWSSVFGYESLPERKPSALPLLEAMKQVATESHETLMIGDGIPDLRAAHNAGVRSVIATFGYTSSDLILPHQPTKMFSSYQELYQIIAALE